MRGIVIVKDRSGKKHFFFPKINRQVVELCNAGIKQLSEKRPASRPIGGGAVAISAADSKRLVEVFRRIAVVSCGESAWERMMEYRIGAQAPGIDFFIQIVKWAKLYVRLHNFVMCGGCQ